VQLVRLPLSTALLLEDKVAELVAPHVPDDWVEPVDDEGEGQEDVAPVKVKEDKGGKRKRRRKKNNAVKAEVEEQVDEMSEEDVA
jgi:hypothetical protein